MFDLERMKAIRSSVPGSLHTASKLKQSLEPCQDALLSHYEAKKKRKKKHAARERPREGEIEQKTMARTVQLPNDGAKRSLSPLFFPSSFINYLASVPCWRPEHNRLLSRLEVEARRRRAGARGWSEKSEHSSAANTLETNSHAPPPCLSRRPRRLRRKALRFSSSSVCLLSRRRMKGGEQESGTRWRRCSGRKVKSEPRFLDRGFFFTARSC